MQFLNPAVLAGLVAAALPLAIHLLHRGRAQAHPFSDLAFLRQLHHNRMRRVHLRQWLVLLLRMLFIVLVVCAFARPAYRDGGGWSGTRPVAAHLLIDLSYSTRYRLPSGTIFAQLQNQVRNLLAVFTARDRISLQPFAQRPEPPLEGNLNFLAERAAELVPRQGATDLRAALQAATRALDPSAYPHRDRELFLFTDLARRDWEQLQESGLDASFSRVYVVTPQATPRPNAFVADVAIPSWMLAAGNKIAVQANLVHNNATSLENAMLDLFVNGQRLRRHSIDLDARGSVATEFNFSPRGAGRLSGHVELEDDALLLDNRRYFTVDLPTAITALLLGDRPDDTYYPRRALSAATLSDPAFDVRSGLLADLDATTLDGVDVAVLCNPRRLAAAQKAILVDFVAAGGGLILFPGPESDLSYYNRHFLPGLTPTRLKERVGAPGDRDSYQTLDSTAPTHRLLADLLPDHNGPHFYASFAIPPASGLTLLARFADGRPALTSSWQERGRVAVAAFPLDPRWNNLHLSGLFAPLLHRMVRDLSQAPDRRASYLIGETVHRRLDRFTIGAAIAAEAPSGKRLHLQPERIDGQYRWKVPRVDEAGIWRLRAGDEIVDLFAVNPDTRESDLALVDREHVRRVLGNVHFLQPGDDFRLAVLGNRYGRELWREFLLLALALLVLEQWIARAPRDVQPQAA